MKIIRLEQRTQAGEGAHRSHRLSPSALLEVFRDRMTESRERRSEVKRLSSMPFHQLMELIREDEGTAVLVASNYELARTCENGQHFTAAHQAARSWESAAVETLIRPRIAEIRTAHGWTVAQEAARWRKGAIEIMEYGRGILNWDAVNMDEILDMIKQRFGQKFYDAYFQDEYEYPIMNPLSWK